MSRRLPIYCHRHPTHISILVHNLYASKRDALLIFIDVFVGSPIDNDVRHLLLFSLTIKRNTLFILRKNIMFEQTVNKYFKKDAFKTGDNKGKFHYMGWEQNPYVDYLTSKSKSASPSNVLKAVLYTIARTPFVWNIGAPMFKDVRKLPSALKTKILNSIPDKHFMKLVENNCMDYHILGIPFKQYPIDTLMVSILEVFPVLYSNKEFTNDELKKFASIQPKRTSIVINTT